MKAVQWKSKRNSFSHTQIYTAKQNKRVFVLATLFTSLLATSAVAQELSIPCDEVEEKALAEAKTNEVERISAFKPATPLERVYGLPRYCKSKHAVLTKMVCVRISGFSLKYFHFEPR